MDIFVLIEEKVNYVTKRKSYTSNWIVPRTASQKPGEAKDSTAT